MARTVVFTEKRQAHYLARLRETGRLVQSAREVGISHTTVWLHRKQDPVFAQAVLDALDEWGISEYEHYDSLRRQLADEGNWNAIRHALDAIERRKAAQDGTGITDIADALGNALAQNQQHREADHADSRD